MGSRNEYDGNKFLDGPMLAAMLRAIFPQAAFIPKEPAVHAPVNLRSLELISEVAALIDSGATDNFISPQVIQRFEIPTQKLEAPKPLRNVDGTPNKSGAIESTTDLILRYKGRTYTQTFNVADLGGDHILLGMPFLSATNPEINWTLNQFKGIIEASTIDAFRKPLPKRSVDPLQMKEDLQIDYDTSLFNDFTNEIPEEDTAIVRRTTKSTDLAIQAADNTERTWQEQVPSEYHKFGKVFDEIASHRFPPKRPWDHAIDLLPDAPEILDCKNYQIPEGYAKALDEFITEQSSKGYIRPSKSPYASPLFFIRKKDGKPRPVMDYARMNKWTVRNTYPLPLIKELINQLGRRQWFTKFDIRWGYNNVRIKEGDEWKAAFKCNKGLYEPTVMFFGLTNSPATFQTMMDAIFREEITSGDVVIYMDDILIATTGSLEYHRQRVAHVLKKLQDNDLYLKPEKCHFHKQEVDYLGVIVGKGQVKMDPIKVKGITEWPTPTNVSELRSFLGFGNYYKDFIPAYSSITRPLHDLTKKSVQWLWDKPQHTAFTNLKELFTSYPILRNPNPTKRYILDTDASKYAVGAILSQDYPDGRHPVAYFSKSLLPAEKNYDIYD